PGLEQKPAAGRGTRSLLHRPGHCLESRSSPTSVCLLQPFHSREQGRGLRHLPRARGSNVAGRAGRSAHHGLVSRLSSRSRQAPAASGVDHRDDLAAAGGWRAARARADGKIRRAHSNQLHHLPPMKARSDLTACQDSLERQFPMGAAETADGMDRRSFIQLLGASLAASGLAACPRAPPEKSLHYTRQPPDLTPGNPLHYATAFATGAFATGVLATSWEGRPTKIEGNPLHPSSGGATGLFEQASILQLYDPQRARLVKYKGVARAWKSFLAETKQRLDYLLSANRAAGLRFLLEPSGSPTIEDLRRRIAAAFPNARFYGYEALDRDNSYQGARLAFGRSLETLGELENADVILSLDADFLQCIGPH